MNNKKLIQDTINDIVHLLNMYPKPKVIYVAQLRTKAEYTTADNTIRIRKDILTQDSTDAVFVISHEMRHAWQSLDSIEYWMEGYKTSAELEINEYNLQRAELDANAFAMVYCIHRIHRIPYLMG